MPTLEWIGKDKVINHHLDVPYRVLEHQYSYGDSNSGNTIIHGDNLEALKALLPEYEGRVKCIYIDPPYNTGNEGWVYNDNVNDPKMRKWLGEVVGKEGEDLSRHDKWLCMMYPRLKLLQRLLSEDGVIFISIDDTELSPLRLIANEIFGRNCFVSNISWQRTYSTRNDSKGVVNEVEHIIVYSKKPDWEPNKLPRTEAMNAKYKNIDNDVSPWRTDNAFAPGAATHQGMVYAIQHPFTGEMLYPSNGACWRYQQEDMLEIMRGWCEYTLKDLDDAEERALICGIQKEEVRKGVKGIVLSEPLDVSLEKARAVLERGQWPRFFFTKGGKGGIARKTYLENVGGKLPTNLWPYTEVGHTDEAKKQMLAIFDGRATFDTPKPTRLIERILKIVGDPEALVLDSFAGSGTTAHAVLNMNKADGGNRKFILIELMDYAESITAERVKRVIDGFSFAKTTTTVVFDEEIKIKHLKSPDLLEGAILQKRISEELFDKVKAPIIKDGHLVVEVEMIESEHTSGLGGGFDYYELGEPLLIDNKFLNECVPIETIRSYIWYMETRQPLSDIPAQMNESPYFLGRQNETAYYFIYEKESATTLDSEFLSGIKTKADSYIIYADQCAVSANELGRYGITFKKIPRDITKL